MTTADWPENKWPFGPITRLAGETPLQFADALQATRPTLACDVMMSLERVWSCDVYRAGDGVHAAWLTRRRAAQPRRWGRFAESLNRKHAAILQLEESLFRQRRAGRVIANSMMVKNEIVATYSYPAENIDVVPNGVAVADCGSTPSERAGSRHALQLEDGEVAVLFVGSGWERKGLRHALHAIEKLDDRRLKFLVAGRGNQRSYRSDYAQFLGEVADVRTLYRASDIFVLPTLYDPFSNACLEALASGMPVITTTANGFAEVIEDKVHGSIVEEPSVGAIADAIRFWSDPLKREAARPLIVDRASHYDISINVERTLEIVTQAASAASTSGKMRNT